MASNDFRLDGRVAVVTGGLGKLGPVWVGALADAGAQGVGIDLGCGESPGAARVEKADVTDRAALDGVLDRVRSDFGEPSILGKNAWLDQPPEAAAKTQRIEDIPGEEFLRTLNVNTVGTCVVTQV